MKVNIAIVGATGLVGSMFLKVLEEYNVEINELKLFASNKSKGKRIKFRKQEYVIDTIKEGSFIGIDYALFSAGGDASFKYAPQAVSEGAIVIDNSSAFRMDATVPLVVPEVNIEDAFEHKLIANPNCSTIQCMLPLKLLKEEFGISAIEYNTYQAVSGSGQKGIDDLKRTLQGENNQFYPYPINQTCIPQIDVFMEDGYTKEEHKMMNETRKILHNDSMKISATCVRVPVMNSHAVSIRVMLDSSPSLDQVKSMFNNVNGLIVIDDSINEKYPVSSLSNGTDNVYIGRIRQDKINPQTFLLYVVADNIRKGAASNAIQIMLGVMKHEGC